MARGFTQGPLVVCELLLQAPPRDSCLALRCGCSRFPVLPGRRPHPLGTPSPALGRCGEVHCPALRWALGKPAKGAPAHAVTGGPASMLDISEYSVWSVRFILRPY